jgi:hypothetical protein
VDSAYRMVRAEVRGGEVMVLGGGLQGPLVLLAAESIEYTPGAARIRSGQRQPIELPFDFTGDMPEGARAEIDVFFVRNAERLRQLELRVARPPGAEKLEHIEVEFDPQGFVRVRATVKDRRIDDTAPDIDTLKARHPDLARALEELGQARRKAAEKR